MLVAALERLKSLELAPRCLATVRRDDCCPSFTVIRRMPGGPLVTSRAARVGRTKRKSRGLGWAALFCCRAGFSFTRARGPRELSRRCLEGCFRCLLMNRCP